MLSKGQMEKYADVLVWALKTARKGRFKKGDVVAVRYDLAALSLAQCLHGRILDMGMHPVIRMGLTWPMERDFYEKADRAQLVFHPPGEKELCEQLNGGIYLHGPESLTHLSGVDPARIGQVAVARKPLRDILNRREEQGAFGWTLCMVPTAELARRAGLTLRQYANQIVRACYLDKKDPVGEWKKLYNRAAALKRRMNRLEVRYYHIQSKHTDLVIVPGERRKWVGISGHNMPSFELFLSPDWRGTEGVYFADQPSFRSGNYVEGVRLTFRKGIAVKVEAKKGEAFVAKQLSIDKGACRVGEFSLTDKRFSRISRFMANTLFDENFGGRYGNCHIALGASYSDTFAGSPEELTADKKKALGFNDSALHWDLVNTEKKVVTAHVASGKDVVVYEDGMFKD